jgi:hypothetical protein
MLGNITKYAKLISTIVGAVLMVLNEALPIFPVDWQHWVTGVIAVLTIVARDLTDVIDTPLSAKSPKTTA